MARRSRRHGRSKTKGPPDKVASPKAKLVPIRSTSKVHKRKTFVRGRSKWKKQVRKLRSTKPAIARTTMRLRRSIASGTSLASTSVKKEPEPEDATDDEPASNKLEESSTNTVICSAKDAEEVPSEEHLPSSDAANSDDVGKGETCTSEHDESDTACFSVMEDAQEKESMECDGEQNKPDAQATFNCSVCKKSFDSATPLTAHMKQHNTDSQVHKCGVCSKVLSSASSLDRHMLVHSGERPFKCKLCDMAFTTNGNMHRHMRTHGEFTEAAEGNKGVDLRKKDTVKRKLSFEAAPASEILPEPSAANEEQEKLHCPVCGKTFLCKYGLQSHMEAHPNDPILCQNCGEVSVNYAVHTNHKCNILDKKVESSKTICCGFQDLNFIDFSAKKFSLVSKSFCEQKIKRPSSAFHVFECTECKRAFPCGRALTLHMNSHKSKTGTFCLSCGCNFAAPEILKLHQLKHRSVEQCLGKKHSDGADNQPPSAGKEDFLALLNLQTKESQFSVLKSLKTCCVKEGVFENMDYFVHGHVKEDSGQEENNNSSTNSTSNNSNSNNDFADIQSIISLTSKAPLMTAVQSSPVVQPTSPVAAVSPQQPVSPQVAEAASISPETPSTTAAAVQPLGIKCVPDPSESPNNIYSCKICSQRFYNVNMLKRHSKLHMQRGSNYSCHLCSYVSVDKSTLIRHLRTHNGERPFQCIICKYAFTTKANCERHVRKRHKKMTKPEIRSCMQYNPNMVLKASEVTSSEIGNSETVCKYCNVDFKFNRVLRHHLRSLHNSCNRKPFSCKICSFGFSTKNNCIRHVLKQHPEMRDRLRLVVVPNSQKAGSEISGTESDNTTDASVASSHTVNASSVAEESNEQAEPLNLNGKDTEEPLNLRTTENVDAEHTPNEAVIAAESLVSLSETLPTQNEPLDLAARPLDLTLKTQPLSQKFLSKPVSIFSISQKVSAEPDHFLDLSTSRSYVPQTVGCSSQTSGAATAVQTVVHYPKAPSGDRPHGQKFRAFTCVYCSAGFTLKSNMERHIKRKHPEFARPTRSRNFIPAIVAQHPQRNSFTMLSDKTRDALRHVLSTKVHHTSTFASPPSVPNIYGHHEQHIYTGNSSVSQESSSFSLPAATTSLSSKPPAVSGGSSGPFKSLACNVQDDDNSSDLASVSSVICVANSQQFGKYFGKSVSDKNEASEGTKPEPAKPESTNSSSPTQASVSCPFCSRKFPWSSSLRRHILTHTGQKPYKCPRCALWFTTKSNCERHLIRKHGHKGELICRSVPGRPYKCKHCPSSTFATQGNLRKHFYLKHWTKSYLGMNAKSISRKSDVSGGDDNDDSTSPSSDNPTTSSSQSLETAQNCQDHSYSHTASSKSHKCHFCDESFDEVLHLSKHMSVHKHVIYMCYLCRKTFSTSESCCTHFKTSHSLVYMQMLQNESGSASSSASMPGDQAVDSSCDNKSSSSSSLAIACMLCYQKLSSLDDLQLHIKRHMPNTKPPHETQSSVPSSTQNSSESGADKKVPAKSKVQNSLLYLFNASGSNSISSEGSKDVELKPEGAVPEEGSDLIQNLLGIQDSKMIDEMLVSADSAARLLGVKEV